MQINVASPDGKQGVIKCLEDNSFQIIDGDLSRSEIAYDLHFVRPNSACGLVNTIDGGAISVLRSLESLGWVIGWPEVEGAEDEEDAEPGEELIVN